MAREGEIAEDNRPMKLVLTLTMSLAFAGSAPAFAHDSGTWAHKNQYLRSKMLKLGGNPGCDLVAGRCKGVRITGPKVRRYFNVMRRAILPRPAARYIRYGRPHQPPSGAQSIGAGSTLQAIAACESGGNPAAVSPGGKYRGKYQFDYNTWASVGGSGDPAAASESEQDKRAAMLYAQRGAAPWPVCGR